MLIIIFKRKIEYILILIMFIAGAFLTQIGPFFYHQISAVSASGKTIIVIDAGHGGRDPGAVAGDICEKEINLDIAKRLEKILKQKGYRVIMTRTKDTNLVDWKDNGSYQRASLWQRAQLSKEKNAQLLISIHCNSDRNKEFFGSQTFYHPESDSGRRLAQSIQGELIQVRNTRRQALPGNYYLLNNTSCITVIVELGYLSNAKDRSMLCIADFQHKFAQAIARGISKFLY